MHVNRHIAIERINQQGVSAIKEVISSSTNAVSCFCLSLAINDLRA